MKKQLDDLVWKTLNEMYPKAKKLWVRDEFPSNGYAPAIIADDVLYIKWEPWIQFGSTSLLENDRVWYSTPRDPDDDRTWVKNI